jgi:superfamily II DNA/RNA helicase
MYPQYLHATHDDIMRDKMQEKIITVPTRLRKRLEKKMERDATRGAIRQRIIDASRAGPKARCLISCKNSNLNHYYGQTYGKKEEIPLASSGWTSRKSGTRHDYFTIQPHSKNLALLSEGDRTTFEDIGISNKIVEILKKYSITRPTQVQNYAIEQVKNGKHCMIASETGSGKTLAYLLPIFESVLEWKNRRTSREGNSPLALILVPTKELAEQVYEVTKMYGEELELDIKLLQGGHLGSKIANPPRNKNVDIMVSTVHVIKELARAGTYDLGFVRAVVLDEADTLLDDSFSIYISELLQKFAFGADEEKRVQLALVSATMPRSLEEKLEGIVPIEELHKITTNGLHRVMAHVPQKFLRLRKMDKPAKTFEIVKDTVARQVPLMIFCNRSETCNWLTTYLLDKKVPCIGLTAKLDSSQRDGRIDKYKNGEAHILVCTDLASRGIDTINTEHVLNYDFPPYLADYIHRCGRTGRVGSKKNGKVTNFVSNGYEIKMVQVIETSVRKQLEIENVNANIKRLIDVRLSGTSRML